MKRNADRVPMLSIVVPTLNEAARIRATLARLQPLRARGHEVIVVDGGSHDDTAAAATALADRLLTAPRGRASQMNAGAMAARGDVLLFLHADTHLPANAAELIATGLADGNREWGRFDVVIGGRHPLLHVVARLMNLRSHLTGIATGDQALFVRRASFDAVGRFPPIDLMEDVALCRRLRQGSWPLRVRTPVITSARRWEANGVMRTILLMWWLRLRYFLGDSPERLARSYRPAASDTVKGSSSDSERAYH
jgi:rSAM/selenodomain-associated transferase 2